MEKVVFCKLYYFEDTRTKENFYFENEKNAKIARFNQYCKYDYERLTKTNFVVPVTKVTPILIEEQYIKNLNIRDLKTKEDDFCQ